jgi:hypothetical protein
MFVMSMHQEKPQDLRQQMVNHKQHKLMQNRSISPMMLTIQCNSIPPQAQAQAKLYSKLRFKHTLKNPSSASADSSTSTHHYYTSSSSPAQDSHSHFPYPSPSPLAPDY